MEILMFRLMDLIYQLDVNFVKISLKLIVVLIYQKSYLESYHRNVQILTDVSKNPIKPKC